MSGKPSVKTAIIWRKKWEKTREWTAPEEEEEEGEEEEGEEEEGDAEGEAGEGDEEVWGQNNEVWWENKEKGVQKENLKESKAVKEDKVRSYRGKYRKRMTRWVLSALNSTKISQHHHN